MTRYAEHHAFNNPLITDDECTRHATLTACYQLAQSILKIGFALAKGGIGKVGRFSARDAMHFSATLAGCTKALVGTGWAISLHFNTKGIEKATLPM